MNQGVRESKPKPRLSVHASPDTKMKIRISLSTQAKQQTSQTKQPSISFDSPKNGSTFKDQFLNLPQIDEDALSHSKKNSQNTVEKPWPSTTSAKELDLLNELDPDDTELDKLDSIKLSSTKNTYPDRIPTNSVDFHPGVSTPQQHRAVFSSQKLTPAGDQNANDTEFEQLSNIDISDTIEVDELDADGYLEVNEESRREFS